MRIVTPFRPFKPESPSHKRLGKDFDWVDAIGMLRRSAQPTEVVAITDVDTVLPGPSLCYRTTYRRLMPWIVEVAYRYIASDDFDQDTVMVSPDVLVFGDLARWFEPRNFDLGLIARYKADRPMLNAVQFWPYARREAVRALYRMVFDELGGLTERELRWGGDTVPFVRLFGPALPGQRRKVPGVGVVQFTDASDVMVAFDKDMVDKLPLPTRLVDFKNDHRKRQMRSFFDSVFTE